MNKMSYVAKHAAVEPESLTYVWDGISDEIKNTCTGKQLAIIALNMDEEFIRGKGTAIRQAFKDGAIWDYQNNCKRYISPVAESKERTAKEYGFASAEEFEKANPK